MLGQITLVIIQFIMVLTQITKFFFHFDKPTKYQHLIGITDVTTDGMGKLFDIISDVNY